MSRERMFRWQVSIRNPKRAKKIKKVLDEGNCDGALAAAVILDKRKRKTR